MDGTAGYVDPTASAYCSDIDPASWAPSNIAKSVYCGWSQVIGSATPAVQSGQDAAAAIAEDVTEAANPANLAGAGAGLAFGGVVGLAVAAAGAVAVGVVAAGAADLLITGGAGTRAIFGMAASRRR